MSDSEHHKDSTLFGEEEDNNPFPHTSGLASLIQSHKDTSEDAGENQVNGASSTHNTNELHAATEDEEDDDNESILLYRSGGDHYNTVQINYENRVSKLLEPRRNVEIHITEAGKSNEGMANSLKKYIAYTIKLVSSDDTSEEILTRRRYSDFESLRDVLTRVFPLVIIPPIPPKNYFSLNVLNGLVGSNISTNGSSNGHTQPAATETTNGLTGATYSYINSNHLNKSRLIEHRKRLLSNFLNNCLHIPQIRNLDFFAKFLDPSANWSDEITLINSQLPKSVYMLNPENGLKSDSLYGELPLPISNHSIIMPFLNPLKGKSIARRTSKLLGTTGSTAETTLSADSANTQNGNGQEDAISTESGEQMIVKTSTLDDINKKIMENFIGLSNDYVELGTVLNYCSLFFGDSSKNKDRSGDDEDIKVDYVFDKIGLAFDRSYITLNSLIGELETKFSEPLGEAVQYSGILTSIKKFHIRKVRQRDMVDSELKDKRKELADCLRTEMETTKNENAINSEILQQDSPQRTPTTSPSSLRTNAKGRFFPSMNSIKKFSKYVSDIIDQNPEQTRKQRIIQLQARIATLEKCQTVMMEDISYVTDELEKNMKSFRTKELKSIFGILLSYNGILISWAKKNIEIWEEIKEEIGLNGL